MLFTKAKTREQPKCPLICDWIKKLHILLCTHTHTHTHTIAKFRLKVKKVRETTRPLRYDLNQIPYDYIVEVMNRFKGLDLVDRVPEELWIEVCNIIQEVITKTFPKKKKHKKAK